MDETRVRYKAIADFTSIARSVNNLKRRIKELRDEEAKLNTQSVAGSGRVSAANDRRAASIMRMAKAQREANKVVGDSSAQMIVQTRVAREYAQAQNDAATATGRAANTSRSAVRFVQDHAKAQKDNATATKEAAAATESLEGVTRRGFREMQNAERQADRTGNAVRRMGVRFRDGERNIDQARGGAERFMKALDRLDDWRPHWIPPFIALVPIIAGLLALINPLAAGLGAVGAAALGFASNMASAAGSVLTLVPALGTLLSVVGALKVAFGGIGGAFKAFSAMQKATGASGGGTASKKAELTQTEQITRAQEKYARSIQDVTFAQEDLDAARKDYIKRLKELQKAVDQAAMSEARAAANAQLARENYANVLADPGSTKGQKMDAKTGLEEAQAAQKDVIDQNKQNTADLAAMKKKGMDGDRQVIQAQRALTDAIWAQRDAQLALINAHNGTATAATAAEKATAQFDAAMAKLSPSAQRFVRIILSMKDAWDNLRRSVQERFFSKFVDDVGRLSLLFGPLESLLGNAADALGRFVDNFILLVTSPEWQKDIIVFGEGNVPIIDAMGAGVLSLVNGIKDLALAAQPALLRLARGFERGAAALSTMISNARDDGSLAAFLDRSITKLGQWWRIVKNIGLTIYNYSKAAGDFGQWLTDGFEKITQGWLKNSETALGPDSAFRKYLEDVKPLVSEIKNLFADFFGWFRRESMDPKNIESFTDIIHSIRTELGPALSRLFDALSNSDVGPKFVDSISKVIDIISALTDSPAVAFFFDILNALLDALKWIAKNPVLGTILKSIAVGFAAIAAVSFVGKFTGLTSLINLLLKLAKGGGGLPGLLKRIGSSLAGMVGIETAAGAAGGVAAYPAGTRRGPGGGSYSPGSNVAVTPGMTRQGYREAQAAEKAAGKTGVLRTAGKGIAKGARGIGGLVTNLVISFAPDLIAKIGSYFKGGGATKAGAAVKGAAGAVGGVLSKNAAKGINVLSGIGKVVTPTAAKGAGKGFNLLGSVAKGAGRGAGIGAIASIVGSVAGDLISSSAPEGKQGAGQRVGGNTLAGAASGAGIGALAGSVVPGVGTAIGAGVGGVIGALIGFFTSAPEDIQSMIKDWGDFFADIGKWIAGVSTAFWNWLTVDVPRWVGQVADGFMKWLTVDLPGWVKSIADGFYHWLTVDLPYSLGYAAGLFMKWLTVDMPAWLASVWNGFMKWLTVDMPAWVASVAQTIWRWLTVDMPAWVASTANKFWHWLTVDVPAWIGQAADRFWRWLTVDLPGWVGQAADKFWHWLTIDLPNWIGQAATKFWTWLTVDLPKAVVDSGKAIGDGFTKFFTDFFSNTGKFFKGIGDLWNNFWGGIFGNAQRGYNDASGVGDVPGGIQGPTMKKVKALMPSGMHLTSGYRTPAENRAVGGSPTSLHMDKNNPAVDIVGSKSQMAAFARILGRIGGWRQLYYNGVDAPGVGYWPGHDDHIHVANTGGKVPGRGNGDTVPSMLTPGEFVVKKAIVNRVGAENLQRFNAGVMSFAQLLQQGMNQPGKQKQAGGGFDGMQIFGAGGLVPDLPGGGGVFPRPPDGPPAGFGGTSGGGGGAPVIAGDLVINNPAPEPASDSLPRSIRKVAYLGGRRK